MEYNSAQYFALQNKASSGASTINDNNCKTVIQVVLKKLKNNKNNEYDWWRVWRVINGVWGGFGERARSARHARGGGGEKIFWSYKFFCTLFEYLFVWFPIKPTLVQYIPNRDYIGLSPPPRWKARFFTPPLPPGFPSPETPPSAWFSNKFLEALNLLVMKKKNTCYRILEILLL